MAGGGNPTLIAQAIYDYAAGDSAKIAAVEAARDSLITGGALTKGGLNTISSASKNGVAYSMLVGMSVGEQLVTLNLALNYLDNTTRPATRTVGSF